MQNTFDYIVVGGGSGGAVVASRLSEDPACRVCLLEAGGEGDGLLVRMPAGVAVMLPTRNNNWAFKTVPQAGHNNRRGYQPRSPVSNRSLPTSHGHPFDVSGSSRGRPHPRHEWRCSPDVCTESSFPKLTNPPSVF